MMKAWIITTFIMLCIIFLIHWLFNLPLEPMLIGYLIAIATYASSK